MENKSITWDYTNYTEIDAMDGDQLHPSICQAAPAWGVADI